MLRKLWRLLIGDCRECAEKDRRLSDLMDRLMSRDFSQLAFVRAQKEMVKRQEAILNDGDGRVEPVYVGDGSGSEVEDT